MELVPASLEANLDALEAYVTGAVEELSADGLDCTDPDNYRWAKGARAQLNRMAKAVSQERNRVKRDYMRPFKAFEDRCKAIERKATDAAKRLGEPIAEADEAWRARRTAELEAFYAEGADLLAPVVPLPASWTASGGSGAPAACPRPRRRWPPRWPRWPTAGRP